MSKKDDLVELSYKSNAIYDFGILGIMRLFENSYHWNIRHGLTGVLFYDHAHFGQILEGKRVDVEEIWSKIQQDSRHRQIQLLGIREIDRRRFPNWALKIYDGKEFSKVFPEFASAIGDVTSSSSEVLKAVHDLGFRVEGDTLSSDKTINHS